MTATRPPAFPVALRLEGRRCVVVGSAPELATRAEALVEAGARVIAVSERPPEAVKALAAEGRLELRERPFADGDLDDAWLAVLVDVDDALAERIGRLAETRHVWFCAIDQPRWNTFAHVALAKAGPLRVAVSTSGRAPALAKRLREELERAFADSDFADLVEALGELRDATAPDQRKRVLDEALRGLAVEIWVKKGEQ